MKARQTAHLNILQCKNSQGKMGRIRTNLLTPILFGYRFALNPPLAPRWRNSSTCSGLTPRDPGEKEHGLWR